MPAAIGVNHIQRNLKTLQVLRAIAATSVVYFHIAAIPSFGSFGVDIFFVISGFVMAMVIADGQSPRTFAVSRLARIVPLYWILTTCLLVVAVLTPQLLNSTTANVGNYLKSLFFIPYFKENGQLHPMLTVGWTLNYEMFFYLCIWFSLLIDRRFYIPLILMALAAAYIGLGKNTESKVLAGFFGNGLLFEFFFGMLAYEIHKKNTLKNFAGVVLILAASASYALMAAAEVCHWNVARVYMYGLPSVVLVLSMTALEGASLMKNSALAGVSAAIGDASYATYLSHYYVVEGVRKIAFQRFKLIDPYTPFGVFVVVGSSLAVGHFIYVLCDKPLSLYFKKKCLPAKSPRPSAYESA